MTAGAQCVTEDQTLAEAARMMRDLDVGSLPICGSDGKLHGMLTDRDIALRVTGQEKDPQLTHVGTVMTANPVRISVASTLHDLTMLMHSQHVRRVPIIDASGQAIEEITPRVSR